MKALEIDLQIKSYKSCINSLKVFINRGGEDSVYNNIVIRTAKENVNRAKEILKDYEEELKKLITLTNTEKYKQEKQFFEVIKTLEK